MPAGNIHRLPETTNRNDSSPRLNWLLAANQRATARQQLFRTAQEEQEAALLRQPLTAPEAFARFGLLLGIFPPAALFGGYLLQIPFATPFWWGFALLMNALCALVGWRVGRGAGHYALQLRDTNWFTALPAYALLGFYWAAITGAAGGALFFGIGAFIGPFFALPVGILAFLLFAPLHRLLERGGLLEASQFWPLAVGVTLSLSALILKLFAVANANINYQQSLW